MLEKIVILTLFVTAIHVSMMDGMIFGKLKDRIADMLDKFNMSWAKSPLYECNICMGGIYSLVIYPILWGFSWDMIQAMFGVIGLSVVMAAVIKYLYHGND
jgi:hypothetical protein